MFDMTMNISDDDTCSCVSYPKVVKVL